MSDTNVGSPFKDHATNGLTIDYDSIKKYDDELSMLKQEIIKRNLNNMDSVGYKTIMKAGLPSLLLLLLTFFIGVEYVPLFGNIFQSLTSYINPGQVPSVSEVQPISLWWFPFAVYVVFIYFAFRANVALKREISDKGSSESAITRIIDRYSGIVDGIGTALPLLGAAILLISIEKGPTIFLGFAVPFEIKSILILAIAKLFESVFDALALKYQEIQEEVNTAQRIYYYQKELNAQKSIFEKMIANQSVNQGPVEIKSSVSDEHLRKIYETMKATEELGTTIRNLIGEINNLKLPDEKSLKELEATSKYVGETIGSLKDNNVLKSLDNLVYLTGKR